MSYVFLFLNWKRVQHNSKIFKMYTLFLPLNFYQLLTVIWTFLDLDVFVSIWTTDCQNTMYESILSSSSSSFQSFCLGHKFFWSRSSIFSNYGKWNCKFGPKESYILAKEKQPLNEPPKKKPPLCFVGENFEEEKLHQLGDLVPIFLQKQRTMLAMLNSSN